MSLTLTLRAMFVAHQTNEWLMIQYADSCDNKWLAQLYDNCADDLYHFLLTLSEATLAKDISQKAWLKVIEKRHLYRDSGKFTAWLFTLARNLLIDEIRSQKSLCDFDENKMAVSTNHSNNLTKQFDHALLALPFEQREAFCLQQEGFGLQEIANITHSPIETIKSRLRYAKSYLRKHLEKHHD